MLNFSRAGRLKIVAQINGVSFCTAFVRRGN